MHPSLPTPRVPFAAPAPRALAVAVALAIAALVWAAPRVRADDAVALAARAERLGAEGRLEEAVEAWRRARQLAPDDAAVTAGLAAAHARLGSARLADGDGGAALADLGVAVALAPDRADFHAALAEAARAADEPALARSEVQAALALEPERAGALVLLGQLDYDEGRLAEAEARFRRALAAEPQHGLAKTLLARVERDRAVEATHVAVLTAHFRVQHPPDDGGRRAAERVAAALEEAYGDVGASLGYYPRGLVTALLYEEGEFRAVTSSHAWVAALYDGKIRIPLSKEMLEHGAALERTARHEYVHALVSARTRRCPVWLHEGLAQHFEGKRAGPAALARAAAAGALPPFRDLARGFTAIADRDRVDLVYAQALAFTTFLIDLRGPSEMAAVLDALGRGASLDQALERSFGEDLAALEVRWRAALAGSAAGR